jgi:plastocyanin
MGKMLRLQRKGGEKGGPVRSLFRTSAIVAVAAAAALTVVPVAAANPSKISASDACSPSFNVALMDPNTCTRPGGMPFDVFIQQLQRNKFAGAWHFSPPHVNVDAGNSLTVVNRGGETHSFTQVTQFGGGGIVPQLNEVLFGTPTPPTFFFGPLNLMPSGSEITISPQTLTPGTHLFFCAIHPWMEETVVVH